MIIIKNKVALEKMRTAGQLLAHIMTSSTLLDIIQPGISTLAIDSLIERQMRAVGLKPECKGYGGYKHATLVSPNDVVVHGVPSKDIILKSGDFIKIDVVGSYKGYCADMTRQFFVGQINPAAQHLAEVAQQSLDAAIKKIAPGVQLSDISAAIQSAVEAAGYGVLRDFAGHGIGKDMHEDPDVFNYSDGDSGIILREGMTLAIEPMITEKHYDVIVMDDGWTVKTADGGLGAHVEDTIAVTAHGAEILTRIGS